MPFCLSGDGAPASEAMLVCVVEGWRMAQEEGEEEETVGELKERLCKRLPDVFGSWEEKVLEDRWGKELDERMTLREVARGSKCPLLRVRSRDTGAMLAPETLRVGEVRPVGELLMDRDNSGLSLKDTMLSQDAGYERRKSGRDIFERKFGRGGRQVMRVLPDKREPASSTTARHKVEESELQDEGVARLQSSLTDLKHQLDSLQKHVSPSELMSSQIKLLEQHFHAFRIEYHSVSEKLSQYDNAIFVHQNITKQLGMKNLMFVCW
eukprot:764659-Hanusia_phi.AAC.3